MTTLEDAPAVVQFFAVQLDDFTDERLHLVRRDFAHRDDVAQIVVRPRKVKQQIADRAHAEIREQFAAARTDSFEELDRLQAKQDVERNAALVRRLRKLGKSLARLDSEQASSLLHIAASPL